MSELFSVSDQVVHPRLGMGKISAVQHQELIPGFKHYYVVDIHNKELTVRVPVRMAQELGMRLIMSHALVSRVLETLAGQAIRLPLDYKQRQKIIQEKLTSRIPLEMAATVRDLFCHGKQRYLTAVDSRLLNEGRDALAGEIALASGVDLGEVHLWVDAALESALAQISSGPAAEA